MVAPIQQLLTRLLPDSKALAALVAAGLLVTACSPPANRESLPNQAMCGVDNVQGPSRAARAEIAYINKALSILENHAYFADRVEWSCERKRAAEFVNQNPTRVNSYVAIERAISALNDRHTSLVYPSMTGLSEPRAKGQLPTGHRLPSGIGYLSLPRVSGMDRSATSYATRLHDLMRTIAHGGVCGWIVDLRNNLGGNIVPMLLGLEPLLGPGELSRSVDRNGKASLIASYRDGKLFFNGEPAWNDPLRPKATVLTCR